MRNKISIAYTALTALIVWFGLILQFYISTEKYIIEGRTFTGAFIQILSYYTIQTNLLIAIALTAFLWKPGSAWGRFFSRTTVLTAIAVYITIVGLIYAFVLKGIWQPEGLFKLADNLLHTVSPVMFVLLWLIFVRKEKIKWNQLFSWAIFPFLYLIYSLIRGAITGDYPYNFINAALISYQQIAINAVLVLLLFLFISACFIAVSRLLKKS
jgi:hypothetical protein